MTSEVENSNSTNLTSQSANSNDSNDLTNISSTRPLIQSYDLVPLAGPGEQDHEDENTVQKAALLPSVSKSDEPEIMKPGQEIFQSMNSSPNLTPAQSLKNLVQAEVQEAKKTIDEIQAIIKENERRKSDTAEVSNLKSFCKLQMDGVDNSIGLASASYLDNNIKTVLLSSSNSMAQNSQLQQQQYVLASSTAAAASSALAPVEKESQPSISSHQPLSRHSSTFSSRSHYSQHSSTKISGTGGAANSSTRGGICGGGSLGDATLASLSIKNQLLQHHQPSVNANSQYSNAIETNSNQASFSAAGLMSAQTFAFSSINTGINSLVNPNPNVAETGSYINSATNNNHNSNHPFDTNSLNSNNSAYSGIYSLNNNPVSNIVLKDPIIIRGGGNITIFGVSNRFSEQFPQQLTAKLAPEEFRDTIKQINTILTKELSNSFKWLIFGSLFCCCTLGCSLIPVIFINKKAKLSINKFLDLENQRLYLKLGLRWRLTKLKCNSSSLFEYALLIEFSPTKLLYQPD